MTITIFWFQRLYKTYRNNGMHYTVVVLDIYSLIVIFMYSYKYIVYLYRISNANSILITLTLSISYHYCLYPNLPLLSASWCVLGCGSRFQQ